MEQLIFKLRKLNISIDVVDDQLKLQVPNDVDASSLIQEIRDNKQALIDYIKNSRQSEDFQSIPKAKDKELYVLSSAQRRLHFLNSFERESLAYNIPQIVKVTGSLEIAKISDVFNRLVARHDGFKTRFVLEDGIPFQKILKEDAFKVEVLNSEDGIDAVIKSFIRPFDLSEDCLLRVGVMSEDDTTHYLLMDMHHIISDGVSHGVLLHDFLSFYNNQELPALALQYKDYAEWQQSEEQQKAKAIAKDFWLDLFSSEPDVLELPYDRPRPTENSYKGDIAGFSLNEEQSKALQNLADKEGSTMYMVLLSIYSIFLSKLSSQKEVVIGTPVAGRDHADLQGIIGMFVNTLPLKTVLDDNQTYQDFLKQLKNQTLACFDQQSYPYEELINELNVERNAGRNPLFDVMFSFENYEEKDFSLPGLDLELYGSEHSSSMFDLTLSASGGAKGELFFSFEYSTDLFDRSTIDRFANYFKSVVGTILENQSILISEIEILDSKERDRLIHGLNPELAPRDEQRSLMDAFEEQVATTPNNLALMDATHSLTYQQANDEANKVAQYIIDQEIAPRSVIGLLESRNVNALIGILGILKSGCAYMALESNQPQLRIQHMLEETESKLVLTNAEGIEKLGEEITVDIDAILKNPQAGKIPSLRNGLSTPYIIYTSGSTGNPKGVLTSDYSVLNLMDSLSNTYKMDDQDRVLQFSSLLFDASVEQIWLALLHGGCLVMVPKETLLDSRSFNAYIKEKGVTHMDLTPTYLESVDLSDDNSMRRVVLGGEASKLSTLRKHIDRFRLYNTYGPTETTVTSVCCEITKEDLDNNRVPIGRPLKNTHVYVLNSSGGLVVEGASGELCISGQGVSKGYLNNETLNAEKFVKNPFVEGEIMYRTGDLVRWAADGSLDYLGRIDSQVKIRGFRVELGEISNRLSSHSNVDEAVAVVKKRGEDKFIVGYYLGSQVSDRELYAYLEQTLPEYMIPMHYVHMDRFPMNRSGKLDTKQLPDPDVTSSDLYVAPQTDMEHALASIWSEVLKLDVGTIGSTMNFFSLGGHSLNATVVVNRIHKDLGLDVALKDLFRFTTLESLGAHLQSLEASSWSAIPKSEIKDRYVLSSAQRRLHFLNGFEGASLTYNMPQVLKITGDLDIAKLSSVFNKVVARHESFRTRFVVEDGVPYQHILEDVSFEIERLETQPDINAVMKNFVRPFNLADDSLLRVGVMSENDATHYLLMDMHHIVSDGVSHGVLLSDFLRIYNDEQLEALPLQYKDYAEWQQSEEQQKLISHSRDFWLDLYGKELEVLDLPYDRSRPSEASYRGEIKNFSLSADKSRALQSLAQKEGSTMYMVLLSMYSILLSKLGNQHDIVIGTPVAGREHADLDNIIGMFVNTLPLRTSPQGALSYTAFLSKLKEETLSSFEHQSYPYEELINDLNVERVSGRNPLFDVMFTYGSFGSEDQDQDLPGLSVEMVEDDHRVSKFDLTLSASEGQGGALYFSFEYATDLFDPTTIDRFVSYFKSVVSAVLENESVLLSEISLLSEAERTEQLIDFNNTAVSTGPYATVMDHFESQVALFKNNVALQSTEGSMSYGELSEVSDKIASYLQHECGIEKGDVVGLVLDRNLDLLPLIYGVMKAGGAYIPMGVTYPSERVETIVSDSGMRLLISGDSYQSNCAVLSYNAIKSTIATYDVALDKVSLDASDLAYIIYTSGSTGKPKGVMIEHGSLQNIVMDMDRHYPMEEQDCFLLKTTYTFDVSLSELFGWYHNGGSLGILDSGMEGNPAAILRAISSYGVTHINFVPSMFQLFTDSLESGVELSSLKYFFLAGETLPLELVKKYNGLNYAARLENIYGPTEATIYCSRYSLSDLSVERQVPIGKPMANTRFYVLDAEGQLLPRGVAGELCVGGMGLARGYMNNEELTNRSFVSYDWMEEDRVYRTGDLVRWLSNGNIEYLGRIDSQVKIRGYRIELGEISNQLNAHPQINEGVAVARKKGEDKYLVGYYTGEQLSEKEIQEHLSQTLPEYMIPMHYVHMDRFPMNHSGKLDTKQLPDPDVTSSDLYVAPQTDMEHALASIWSEVLKLDVGTIGSTMNFFSLGGHSLNATVVVNRIHKDLGLDVALKDLFRFTTLESLGAHLQSLEASSWSAIPKSEIKDRYVLSSAQRRLHFLNGFEGASLTYNMPQVLKITGDLDIAKLSSVFNKVVARHESFRTRFVVEDGVPYQHILEDVSFEIERLETQPDINAVMKNFVRPFNLADDSLLRVGVMSENDATHYLLMDMHHIVSDGVSHGVLLSDFLRIYNDEQLEALPLQYKDYAEWQQSEEQQKLISHSRDFWLDLYGKELEVLDLPYDRSRPSEASYRGEIKNFSLSADKSRALQSLAQKEGSTMYMVLLSMYSILLSKLGNQHDIVIGTPVAGREHADLDNIIGMFVNTLPLRTSPQGALSYTAFLSKLKEETLSSFEHQSYPYEELINDLNVERVSGRNPLFDVMFTYGSFGSEDQDLDLPGLSVEMVADDHRVSKFDLTLSASEGTQGALYFSFEYATDLFDPRTIDRFVSYFKSVVSAVLENESVLLSEISLLSEEERTEQLIDFNNTAVSTGPYATVMDHFESQVALFKNNVALQSTEGSMSYGELSEVSDKIASYLQHECGIEKGDVVGLVLDRNLDLLPLIYGVMKAGGAYIPMGVTYPSERVETIVSDSGMRLLISGDSYQSNCAVLSYNAIKSTIATYDVALDKVSLDASDLAYIIYTSGSTGKPKGVMIEHGSLQNIVMDMDRHYPMEEQDCFLLKTTYTFDVSLSELFGWYHNGGSLGILDSGMEGNPAAILRAISSYGVTHINFVPSMFQLFTDSLESGVELSSLKYFFLAGETLPLELVKKYNGLNYAARLENIYGPTEATIYCSRYSLSDLSVERQVPIGKPMANTRFYVLDAEGQLLPRGVAGELCVGGMGLARGYMNNEELTNRSFVSYDWMEEDRVYRTGDLVRWLSNGNIEYLGRIDSQVKIRGYRIELGEISNQLNAHPQINEGVAVARKKGEDKYLVGYYTGEQLSEKEIQEHLSQTLPEYMIPMHYVHMDRFPMNHSGKLDTKQLPDPDVTSSDLYVAPQTDMEHALASIWSEVLKLDVGTIGSTMNFFSLGGHSLNATVVVNRIHKDLGLDVALKDLFRFTTLESLGAHLQSLEASSWSAIPKSEIKDRYVLSSAQRRLHFLNGFEGASLTYNMPQVLKITGDLDIAKLSSVFNKVVARHESFRTRFVVEDGIPYQQILEDVVFEIEHLSAQADLKTLMSDFIRPFDLTEDLLLRVGLQQVSPQEHYLLMDMHHIISDGVSHGVLLSDFLRIYNDEQLEALPLQYKDYAQWQQSEEQQALISQSRDFWLDLYGKELEVLELPYDRSRPSETSYSGEIKNFSLSADKSKALQSLAQKQGSTMYMVLLSMYSILLSKLGNQQDIVIGTPVAGREHADLDNIIGMFVNTLPLRTSPQGALSYTAFLSKLKEETLSSFEHQSYPYEELINELNVERVSGRNPLFDVMFTYGSFGSEDQDQDLPGLSVEMVEDDHTVSKFDLTLSASEGTQGALYFSFEYATDLFDPTTIDRFVSYFKSVVSAVLENESVLLSEISLLSEEERTEQLIDFNNTAVSTGPYATVMDHFESQVALFKNNVALQSTEGSMSYGELSEVSDKIASYLQHECGIEKGDVVGLVLDRNLDLLPLIYGVMKAGGAYIPMGVTYPSERVETIVSDSGMRLLISGDSYQSNCAVLSYNAIKSTIATYDVALDKVSLDASDLAYIIYTSGSTGKPKGVMIEHGSLQNIISDTNRIYPVKEGESILLKSAYTFDFSVLELMSWFAHGGSMTVLKKDAEAVSSEIIDTVNRFGVTHITFVPSMLSVFVDEAVTMNSVSKLESLKFCICGGESLSIELVNKFRALNLPSRLENIYGPTEATIYCSRYSLSDLSVERQVPIGKPMANTRFYVLDAEGQLLPRGVAGELCVGGMGLARGYMNNEELTNRSFVSYDWMEEDRVYRTGDLVRWLSNGNIEYLGRIDSQVKIRGYRIELGEISNQLNAHPQINEGVAVARKKGEDKYLVGYYTGEQLSEKEIQEHLSQTLPEYMVPMHYVHMDRFPMNHSGKLDTKQLPDPDVTSSDLYVAPQTDMEHALASIWSEVLKLDVGTIGSTMNFFSLGGHSLNATVVVNRIHKDLGLGVALKDLFRFTTLESLGAHLQSLEASSWSAIPKSEIKDRYVLSSAQRRLHFLNGFEGASLTYNMPQVLKITGDLDIAKLSSVFNKVVARHESFRTRFVVEDGVPYQHILEDVSFEIERLETQPDINAVMKNFVRPFNLADDSLLRVGVMSENDATHYLLMDMHHIVSDGVSHGVLLSDFLRIYNDEQLEALPLQYKDYAEWQQSEEQQKLISHSRDFWLDLYGKELEVLDLPYDRSRPSEASYRGEIKNFSLSADKSRALQSLAQKEGSTMYMVLLSMYSILLSKLGNQHDIVIGTPVAGREHADLDNIIGMFVNTLPLRTSPQGALSYTAFLSKLKEETLSSFEHQSYPYEELINDLNVERVSGRNPLFDVMFTYGSFGSEDQDLDLPGLSVEMVADDHRVSKFDLTLSASEGTQGALYFSFEYATDLFDPRTIDRFVSYFKSVVSAVLENESVLLSEISLLSEEERTEQLIDFNNTAVSTGPYATVMDHFESQVALFKNNVALQSTEGSMSYGELSEVSDKIASYLQHECGIEKGDVVGLVLDRNLDLLPLIYGVMKAGGAYIPMGVTYPSERVETIVSDSGMRLLISGDSYQSNCAVLSYNAIKSTIATYNVALDKVSLDASDLAYIIYTSGSTGKPKGVMIEHGSLQNIVMDMDRHYPMEEQDCFLLKTTYTFDVSLSELFGWYHNGGSLGILDSGMEGSPAAILRAIASYRVTHINFVPSMFQLFTDSLESGVELSSLKYFFLAGEALPLELVKKYNGLNYAARLENIYGPTEATIYCSRYSLSDLSVERQVPIGKPMANTRFYVLDAEGKLLPRGVAGELCVGGMGLARGYMNNEELTNRSFVSYDWMEEDRVYRTGDLVRWLSNGNIEYLGRIDSQVKIRGYRIELGEISNQLNAHSQINEGVAVARKRGEDKYLVGYYTGEQLSDKEIQEHLSQTLPEYMIPMHYVHMDRFPMNRNGKLDYKQLPDPEITKSEDYQKATTPTEITLVKIWSEILHLEEDIIGTTDNFFDLGGHSLRAAFLNNKIHKDLEVETTLNDIFEFQDIKSLAVHIDGSQKSAFVELQKVEDQDYYPLSMAQEQMYYMYEMDETSTLNNMYSSVVLHGELDIPMLEEKFNQLIQRHESLRTSFVKVEGEPKQQINDEFEFAIEFHESSSDTVNDQVKAFIRAFDLEQTCLIRVGLFKLDLDEHVMVVDIHHIVADGVSTGVLINDFMALFNNEELPEINYRYRDFVAWEQSEEAQKELQRQREFWIKEFEGDPELLELPKDFENVDSESSNEGDSITISLTNEQVDALKAFNKEEGTTMFVTTFSIFNVLLNKITNQNDIVLGTPVAGRSRTEFQDTIGVFINTLHLRNQVDTNDTFSAFTRKVHQKSIDSFESQAYVFDENEVGHTSWFEVFFAYQNFETPELFLGDLKVGQFDADQNQALKDLTLTVFENGDLIHFNFEYALKAFKRETIERMTTYLSAILDQIISNKEVRIADIDILGESENERLQKYAISQLFPVTYGDTLPEMLERQSERTPHKIALSMGETSLTYEELNARGNQMAGFLKSHGVLPGDVVGLIVDRSIEVIVAMLGIVKASATYLPLDGEQPVVRNEAMMNDSQVSVLISSETYHDQYSAIAKCVSLEDEELEQFGTDNLPLNLTGDDVAYIIYTSGSTGVPKGVQVPHRGVPNLIESLTQTYGVDASDKILLFSSMLFDASVEQIWLALANGAELVLLSKEDLLNKMVFNQTIRKKGLTHVDLTPSFLDNLKIEKHPSLKRIVLGGEACKISTIEPYINDYRIFNAYGPTETTVTSIVSEITQDQIANNKIYIGKPIANTRAYICDSHGKLVPEGTIGELCLGGVGVTKGYLNDGEKTNSKFIENPYVPGEKMYKTGDLVKWSNGGNLEFIGRVDQQVKIRGLRIELGEIENQLLTHNQISEVVVVANQSEREPFLVAYFVAQTELKGYELSDYLLDKLANYMIPSYYVQMDQLPLNVSGKVDHKALPEPDTSAGTEYVAPETRIAHKLCEIWAEVLELEVSEVGINNTFFELGGHSLKAVNLLVRIENEFGVKIPLFEFIQNPIVRELDRLISSDVQYVKGILPLNEHADDQANAFLVHDGTGELSGYSELIENLSGINVWGIRFDAENPSNSLDAVIDDYVQLILGIEDHPKAIIGWSDGGVFAYEIARELRERAHQVGELILIDTHFYEASRKTNIDRQLLDDILEKSQEDIDTLRSLLPDYVKQLVPGNESMNWNQLTFKLETIETVHSLTTQCNFEGNLNISISYFKAGNEQEETFVNWSGVKGINYIELEEDHFSILTNSTVQNAIVEACSNKGVEGTAV